MQITEVRLDNQITHLALVGKLDIVGLHAVDVKFHALTAARRVPALVDISAVDMVSSLGMGMFISCARSLQRHGAKLVLLNPQPHIEEALRAVGIDQGVPIVHSVADGMQILFPGTRPL
jgi:anti-sigma B factor antagonist